MTRLILSAAILCLCGLESVALATPDGTGPYWALEPPRRTDPGALTNSEWPRTEIDRHVLARLEREGLRPVGDADYATLVRRVTQDLTGLPPTPQEIDQFLVDPSAEAFERVVDRLLDSPRYGEHWGRHWLDVARYAESTGKERNVPYRYAWRYRDYVIDAFNADKPYDRLILEQIAGDLLPAASPAERNDLLVATGFLAIGTRGLNERNAEQFAMDVADEQIDATTRSVLALTVSCARCHDHKFDPIPTEDYYALAGIFRSTETLSGVGRGNNKAGYTGALMPLEPTETSEAADGAQPSKPRETNTRQEIARLAKQLARARGEAAGKGLGNLNRAARQNRQRQARKKVAELEQRLGAMRTDLAGDGVAMAVREAAKPRNCRVNVRGDVRELGPEVPRGLVSALVDETEATIAADGSGRLELARWLASAENPLTARVLVNRVWSHLFGRGIVASVDNFGALGSRPSHPALLDHLALRLVELRWSVKRLIREIVLSRVYQLSSAHDAANYERDPDNVLHWRMSRRRLSAEALRDALLAVSGQLDPEPLKGSLVQQLPQKVVGRPPQFGDGVDFRHRSVYLPIIRDHVPEILALFDGADPSLVVGRRDVTTVAPQALYMMNSPFVAAQSDAMAQRLLAQGEKLDVRGRVDLAYRIALGRSPSAGEMASAVEFLDHHRLELQAAALPSRGRDRTGGSYPEAGLASLCQVLLSSAEFRYVY